MEHVCEAEGFLVLEGLVNQEDLFGLLVMVLRASEDSEGGADV